MTVVPSVNLVANLGNAVGHGLPPDHPLARLEVGELGFPLRPPESVAADRRYDRLHVERIFEWWEAQAQKEAEARRRGRALHRRVVRKLRRITPAVHPRHLS